MSALKQLGLDGRLVFATAVAGLVLQLALMSLAKPRGIRDRLLIQDAVWATVMAVVFVWAVASVRRGPVGGRQAACWTMLVCVQGVACVMVELVWYILQPTSF